jgi:DNA-binding transcriptional LysR family regulator
LLEHDCLRYTLDRVRNSWRFKGPGGEVISVPVTGAFESNHGGALRQAAVAGLGIAYLPRFYAQGALQRGELVTLLDDYCEDQVGIHAVYPATKKLPPKTRACVDWLASELPARLASGDGER